MKTYILVLFLFACSFSGFTQGFIHKGIYREYLIHVPANYTSSKPIALLIALHGGFGSGVSMEKFSNFNSISDRDTFIVVYPSGFQKHWNDGRNVNLYETQSKNLDDVGFIEALIDSLSTHYKIDQKRIYATGASNGGMMSYRLALELSTKIAAIAPVIANIPSNLADKKPVRPMPVLIINGTADPLMPYEGGDVKFRNKSIGKVLSSKQTFDLFSSFNNCSNDIKTTSLTDSAPEDGCTATVYTHLNCQEDHSVILYCIQNGGHSWPGGSQYLPKTVIGNVCKDFNASEVIWSFLRKYKLP